MKTNKMYAGVVLLVLLSIVNAASAIQRNMRRPGQPTEREDTQVALASVGTCSVKTNAGCAEGFWCRETCNFESVVPPPGPRCVPYRDNGESCGGLFAPCAQQKCHEGLVCDSSDNPASMTDAPGRCKHIANVRKSGQCPLPPAAGQAGVCGTSCANDYSCPASKKCCSNGCGFSCQEPDLDPCDPSPCPSDQVCVPNLSIMCIRAPCAQYSCKASNELTACQAAHAFAVSKQAAGGGGPIIFIPICLPDGQYAPKQCDATTGLCYCVDISRGAQIAGTETRNGATLDCDVSAGLDSNRITAQARAKIKQLYNVYADNGPVYTGKGRALLLKGMTNETRNQLTVVNNFWTYNKRQLDKEKDALGAKLAEQTGVSQKVSNIGKVAGLLNKDVQNLRTLALRQGHQDITQVLTEALQEANSLPEAPTGDDQQIIAEAQKAEQSLASVYRQLADSLVDMRVISKQPTDVMAQVKTETQTALGNLEQQDEILKAKLAASRANATAEIAKLLNSTAQQTTLNGEMQLYETQLSEAKNRRKKFQALYESVQQQLKSTKGLYDYKQRGSDWPLLCLSGTRQSPIALHTDSAVNFSNAFVHTSTVLNYYSVPAFEFPSTTGRYKLQHARHSVKLIADLGTVQFENIHYHVRQLIFRAPSEHTIDGEAFDMEMQIFAQKDGAQGNEDLLIIAVLFVSERGGVDHPLLTQVGLDRFPAKTGESIEINGTVSLSSLNISSATSSLLMYRGSATTPTCDETATWLVLSSPRSVSEGTLDRMRQSFALNTDFAAGKGNARVQQPLNKRYVTRIDPSKPVPEVSGLTPGYINVTMRVTGQWTYDKVNNPLARKSFVDSFVSDVSTSLGVLDEQIVVSSLTPDGVTVNFSVHDPPPRVASSQANALFAIESVGKLHALINTPNSVLFKGTITKDLDPNVFSISVPM